MTQEQYIQKLREMFETKIEQDDFYNRTIEEILMQMKDLLKTGQPNQPK